MVILNFGSLSSTMAYSFDSKAALFAAFILMSASLLPTANADIRIVNQCPYSLTVFWGNGATGVIEGNSVLGPNTNAQLGLPLQWESGLVWASGSGNVDRFQCTQLEISIAPVNDPTRDYYDISLVNAYNVPAMINPTFLANGDVRNGLDCGTPTCTIADLSGCSIDNYFAGPDNACINEDGPWTMVPTPSTEFFKTACPAGFSNTNDYSVSVYNCATGSQYDFIFCP